MSRIEVYAEDDPAALTRESEGSAEIASIMDEVGVGFERWPLRPLAPGDDALTVYAPEIARLSAAGGYRTADVIALAPDHPERAALRTKFLSEHTHDEDEVRFFVAGAGLFTIHAGGKVFALTCTAGDLIRVPAGTPHWFDMGPAPSFTAIRLFSDPKGWEAAFTGADIAERFPRLEAARA